MTKQKPKWRKRTWEDGYTTGIMEGLRRAEEIMNAEYKKSMKKWTEIDWDKELRDKVIKGLKGEQGGE